MRQNARDFVSIMSNASTQKKDNEINNLKLQLDQQHQINHQLQIVLNELTLKNKNPEKDLYKDSFSHSTALAEKSTDAKKLDPPYIICKKHGNKAIIFVCQKDKTGCC